MKAIDFVPREFDIFGGLDVDKKSIAVTFMSHQGMIQSFSIPNRAEYLLNYVGKHFAGKKIAFAYEAGPTGWGLYDSLTSQGHACLVAAPAMIPKLAGTKSEDQPPRQPPAHGEPSGRAVEEHSRAQRVLSPIAPAGSAARYLGARYRGDQASDQSDAAV